MSQNLDLKFNYLKSQNADYIEDLYAQYLADPSSVDESWRFLFEGIELGSAGAIASPQPSVPTKESRAQPQLVAPVTPLPETAMSSEAKVGELIQAYRRFGILAAHLNPLAPAPSLPSALDLAQFGLSTTDLDRKFTAAKMIGLAPATLREIIATLQETYCKTIGIEYSHIHNPKQYMWLEMRMESCRNRIALSKETKVQILKKLTQAEAFERFLHTRFVAQKRFSVEGADVLIPMLDAMIFEAAEAGVTDVVMGMAHRGRLNVLTNIFGKKYKAVFSEFEGNYKLEASAGEGDVKYHMGYSTDFKTSSGKSIHLSLGSNPSHLEFINPVVEGVAFAKQRQKLQTSEEDAKSKVLPVLIHGDAAFAGQGVVYETLQLSLLNGYSTGGTIHIVVNNQVGFTTDPKDARSTRYATDLAKMLETPVFHVNGDDPESAYYVIKLALEYRQIYHRDVVIDVICYRKYGHNEGDEPAFTQPLMYKVIKDHPSPREIYAKKLIQESIISSEQEKAILDEINMILNENLTHAKSTTETLHVSVFEGVWKNFRRANEEDFSKTVNTSVDEKVLREIGQKLSQVPADFRPHPKLERLLEQRAKMVAQGEGIDWGMGEALAFGSLVYEGTHVRLSGQDSERGTFSHRHSVLYDCENSSTYVPLNHLKENQANYAVYNSCLSEAAVLGFEYGFSIADPNALSIWEAQFGDFANGAQVMIDQFLGSSESKWQRMSGLVLLLPHGYEGQGPEHSSARLERFLQLCGRLNLQVGNFTTPAQIFHALRRQVRREFRKPLIVMSPKSLLRHPQAISSLSDFTNGHFLEVIPDQMAKTNARKVLFCTGKIYYDLVTAIEKLQIKDVAVVRIEQLYPWPSFLIKPILEKHLKLKEVFWVQEEPRNMGAWMFIRDQMSEMLASHQKLSYIGRGTAAAPAVGSSKIHALEQQAIIEEALK